eukprot:GHVS01067052.1.p1 GENE.GHVS01067052.1~~GHVS01067052.1.p1  ORF type:complete len:172 (-),score=25.18 GHVS01067052.1:111-626(-)
MEVTVKEKADSLYPVVSAASICAKVTRDRLLKEWPAASFFSSADVPPLGSGYPGDPFTKKFLDAYFDKLYGYPPIVRFSWSTARDRMEQYGHAVDWFEADEDKKQRGSGPVDRGAQSSIRSFFGVSKVTTGRTTTASGSAGNKVESRSVAVLPRSLRFLSRNRLQAVTEFC